MPAVVEAVAQEALQGPEPVVAEGCPVPPRFVVEHHEPEGAEGNGGERQADEGGAGRAQDRQRHEKIERVEMQDVGLENGEVGEADDEQKQRPAGGDLPPRPAEREADPRQHHEQCRGAPLQRVGEQAGGIRPAVTPAAMRKFTSTMPTKARNRAMSSPSRRRRPAGTG